MPDLVARLNAALEGRYAIEILRRRRSSITSVPSALAMMLALFATPLAAQANPAQEEGRSLRIGIIGSGAMGAPIGLLWAEAGHQVMFSSRNPDQLMDLVRSAAPRASAGYADAAAFFGGGHPARCASQRNPAAR